MIDSSEQWWSLPPDILAKAGFTTRRAPRGGIASGEREYKGGQFIPAALWDHEKRVAVAEFPVLMETFGDRIQFLRLVYEQSVELTKGKTPAEIKRMPLRPAAVEYQMKSLVRETYARAFLLGKRAAGNLTSVTDAEARKLTRVRYDEFKYLRRFLGDIRGMTGTMNYARRMDYYRAATRELFWLGFVMGDTTDERFITWRRNPRKESCRDCLRFDDHGPYTVSDFIRLVLGRGYLPQSGKLACMGYNCGCSLIESFAGGARPSRMLSTEGHDLAIA